jgi:nicotinamidase-related amidase
MGQPAGPTHDPYTAPRFQSSVLVTIDVQRDVLDGGRLEIAGTSQALGGIVALLRAYRDAGRPIVHVVRLYRPDASNVDPCRRGAVEAGAEILRPGSEGAELAGELLPEPGLTLDHEALLAGAIQPLGPGEVVVYKPRWGAFYGTALERHLREAAIDTLVFCGCNFPNCPRTSIYEASERDFRVVLVRDAISGLYERGERELRGIGVHVMDTSEVLASLRKAAIA